MLELDNFFKILDSEAPLDLSHKLIEKGDYDNSGILVRSSNFVGKVLFSLDLSINAIKRAKRLRCDTICTHHPAIYTPVKNLNYEGENSALLLAVKKGLNVISMHLNLDVAPNGIDQNLMLGLGGEKFKLLDVLCDANGYGREFNITPIKLSEYVKYIKLQFNTNKVLYYGKKNAIIKKVASFCGGGAGYAINYINKGIVKADTIITSDMPHHVILPLVEKGKNIILLTHYTSENYGFKKFYERISKNSFGKVETCYYEDKRFM